MVSQSIRVCFSKTGRMQFISHLDLQRTMQGAIKRARLPVKYTEGFNPHMKMSFALPLSIGTESDKEFMDLVLTAPMGEEALCCALQAQLPKEIRILGMAAPVYTYAQIGWASYRLIFAQGQCTAGQVEGLLSSPLVIVKRTKNGDREVDISTSVAKYQVTELGGCVILEALLRADNAGYLNPEYLAKAIGAEDYTIRRLGVYLTDGVTAFC